MIGRTSGGRRKGGKMPRYAQRHQTNLIECELGEVVDLSRTGLRAKRDSKPPVKVGQLVQLKLASPGTAIPLVGRIVWIKRKGLRAWQLGVMFMNVRPSVCDDLESLAMYGFVQKGKRTTSATSDLSGVSATFDTPKYYELLGLEPGADQQEIHDAFRSLARQYHPDVNPDGQEQFIKIKEAYEILRDPKSKRKAG